MSPELQGRQLAMTASALPDVVWRANSAATQRTGGHYCDTEALSGNHIARKLLVFTGELRARGQMGEAQAELVATLALLADFCLRRELARYTEGASGLELETLGFMGQLSGDIGRFVTPEDLEADAGINAVLSSFVLRQPGTNENHAYYEDLSAMYLSLAGLLALWDSYRFSRRPCNE